MKLYSIGVVLAGLLSGMALCLCSFGHQTVAQYRDDIYLESIATHVEHNVGRLADIYEGR